jgi:hypothetical protein
MEAQLVISAYLMYNERDRWTARSRAQSVLGTLFIASRWGDTSYRQVSWYLPMFCNYLFLFMALEQSSLGQSTLVETKWFWAQ